MLQYRLTFGDNLPVRMIETNEKEADRMVAEDTLMYKEGHADGVRDNAIDMIRSLHKKNVSICDLAEASKLTVDEIRKILSEE